MQYIYEGPKIRAIVRSGSNKIKYQKRCHRRPGSWLNFATHPFQESDQVLRQRARKYVAMVEGIADAEVKEIIKTLSSPGG